MDNSGLAAQAPDCTKADEAVQMASEPWRDSGHTRSQGAVETKPVSLSSSGMTRSSSTKRSGSPNHITTHMSHMSRLECIGLSCRPSCRQGRDRWATGRLSLYGAALPSVRSRVVTAGVSDRHVAVRVARRGRIYCPLVDACVRCVRAGFGVGYQRRTRVEQQRTPTPPASTGSRWGGRAEWVSRRGCRDGVVQTETCR